MAMGFFVRCSTLAVMRLLTSSQASVRFTNTTRNADGLRRGLKKCSWDVPLMHSFTPCVHTVSAKGSLPLTVKLGTKTPKD
eukprot:scaffold285128_cov21-Tisochrysis_lutea.AAC.1